MSKLGDTIAQLRKSNGQRNVDVSRAAGINPSFLNDIEHGNRSATVEKLERIAVALNAPAWMLIEAKLEDQAGDRYEVMVSEKGAKP